MTDREKLVDLLWQCVDIDTPFGEIADHLLANGVTFQKWIPVSERLPEEKESMYERWFGTDRWLPGMFRMTSDEVIVATVYNDGSSKVQAMRTLDGEWSDCRVFKNLKVTHWMPLPEPPKEVDNE